MSNVNNETNDSANCDDQPKTVKNWKFYRRCLYVSASIITFVSFVLTFHTFVNTWKILNNEKLLILVGSGNVLNKLKADGYFQKIVSEFSPPLMITTGTYSGSEIFVEKENYRNAKFDLILMASDSINFQSKLEGKSVHELFYAYDTIKIFFFMILQNLFVI